MINFHPDHRVRRAILHRALQIHRVADVDHFLRTDVCDRRIILTVHTGDQEKDERQDWMHFRVAVVEQNRFQTQRLPVRPLN